VRIAGGGCYGDAGQHETDDTRIPTMTAAEFAARLQQLIADARAAEFSDEAIIAALSEAVDALEEGRS